MSAVASSEHPTRPPRQRPVAAENPSKLAWIRHAANANSDREIASWSIDFFHDSFAMCCEAHALKT